EGSTVRARCHVEMWAKWPVPPTGAAGTPPPVGSIRRGGKPVVVITALEERPAAGRAPLADRPLLRHGAAHQDVDARPFMAAVVGTHARRAHVDGKQALTRRGREGAALLVSELEKGSSVGCGHHDVVDVELEGLALGERAPGVDRDPARDALEDLGLVVAL